MKKAISLFVMTTLLVSCGGNPNSSVLTDKQPSLPNPKTYKEALSFATDSYYKDYVDTFALGFHTGMTKNQVNEHLKILLTEKKVFLKNGRYMYKSPLTHYASEGNKTEDYQFRIVPDYYQNTLKSLSLFLKGSENNHLHNVDYHAITTDDLEKNFGRIFKAKGYFCEEVNPEWTMEKDKEMGILEASWRFTEYRFVKNRTLIRLWAGHKGSYSDRLISYYDMQVINREIQDNIRKKNEAKKKAAQEEAERAAKKDFSDF